MRFILLILVLLIFPSAQVRAEFDESDASGEYPESTQERRNTRGFGSILGTNPDTGALQVFGKSIGKTEKKQADTEKSPVKSNISDYFWQASIDSVRSMPIVAIDAKAGFISTDWHETEPNTRYKFNILIEDNKAKINAFKQIHKTDGWSDVKNGAEQASGNLLNKIMSRAKKLQSKNEKQK